MSYYCGVCKVSGKSVSNIFKHCIKENHDPMSFDYKDYWIKQEIK